MRGRVGCWGRWTRALTLGLGLAGGLFAGCTKSASVEGRPLSTEAVAKIVDGHTTEEEIREWFGSPGDLVMTNNGKVLTYRYRKEAGGLLSIPLLRIGGGTTSGQLLIVTVDESGRVIRHTFIGGP